MIKNLLREQKALYSLSTLILGDKEVENSTMDLYNFTKSSSPDFQLAL